MQSYATKILSITIIFLMVLSCNKNKFNKTQSSEVKFKASSNQVTIAGKQFVMDKISIDFSDLQLKGERIQGEPVSQTMAMSAPVNFLSSSVTGKFEIPFGTYTAMNIATELSIKGTPSVSITGTYYLSNGSTHYVDIRLDIEEDFLLDLEDTDGSSTILIDENQTKIVVFELDVETLFSDLNPGLWNAAAVTSNNGSNTVVVDEMNNQNIYNAISGKIGESFEVRFE